MHSLLNRAIRHAMARDKVKRNVVTLCGVPTGQPGRAVEVADPRSGKRPSSPPPSGPGFARYIVLSLLTGDGCDREGLPAPAPRRAERGCHRDGRHLPAGRRELVTQVVTQLGGRANTRITRWGCDLGWTFWKPWRTPVTKFGVCWQWQTGGDCSTTIEHLLGSDLHLRRPLSVRSALRVTYSARSTGSDRRLSVSRGSKNL